MQEQVNPSQNHAHACCFNDNSEMTIWPLLENEIEKSHYYTLYYQSKLHHMKLLLSVPVALIKYPQQSNLMEKWFT